MSSVSNTNRPPILSPLLSKDASLDYLQLRDSKNGVIGWIDGRGVLSGTLAAASVQTNLSLTGNGSAASPLAVNRDAVYATDYGVTASAKFIDDMQCASGSKTVTSATANFTQADVGKIVFGTNATTDISAITAIVVVPQGTITAVINSTTITVSVAANQTLSGATVGYLIWGYDEGALLANAYTASVNAGLTLVLPSGNMLTSIGLFNTSIQGDNAVLFPRQGVSIAGQGFQNTIIIPLPNFDWTTATGSNGLGHGAFLCGVQMHATDFQINGFGQSALGASANSKAGVTVSGIGAGSGCTIEHVYFQGWGSNTNGFIGVEVQSDVNGHMSFCNIESFGKSALIINTTGYFALFNVAVSESEGPCFQQTAGNVFSYYSYIGFTGGTGSTITGNFNSFGDRFLGPIGSGPTIKVNAGSTMSLFGSQVTGGVTAGLEVAGTVSAAGTTFVGGNEGLLVDNGGVFVDLGGNTFTNGSSVAGSGIITQQIHNTVATSASAGSNGAVPNQVVGYLVVSINGTNQKIPYFAV